MITPVFSNSWLLRINHNDVVRDTSSNLILFSLLVSCFLNTNLKGSSPIWEFPGCGQDGWSGDEHEPRGREVIKMIGWAAVHVHFHENDLMSSEQVSTFRLSLFDQIKHRFPHLHQPGVLTCSVPSSKLNIQCSKCKQIRYNFIHIRTKEANSSKLTFLAGLGHGFYVLHRLDYSTVRQLFQSFSIIHCMSLNIIYSQIWNWTNMAK